MKQQTAVALVLATALTLSGCSLVGRSRPSVATDGGAGRVVLEDAGVAVTFPDDWQSESLPSTTGGGVAAVLGPDQRDLLIPVVSEVSPTMHDRCVVSDIGQFVLAHSEWRTLDDVLGGFEHLLAADPRWADLDVATLELAVGQTGRISRVVNGEAASVTTYVFARPDAWIMLECFSETIPTPDWSSIAATLEFLPAAE